MKFRKLKKDQTQQTDESEIIFVDKRQVPTTQKFDITSEMPIIDMPEPTKKEALVVVEPTKRAQKYTSENRRPIIIMTCIVGFAFLLGIALILTALNSGTETNGEASSQETQEIKDRPKKEDESALVVELLKEFPAFSTGLEVADFLGIEESELTDRLEINPNQVVSDLETKTGQATEAIKDAANEIDIPTDEISETAKEFIEDFDAGDIANELDPRDLLQ